MESVRCVSHDMWRMLSAAEKCRDVEALAASTQPADNRTGGCQNILIDDMMPDFAKSYTE